MRSDDCISVSADGEPWDECGFQAFAMNAAGNRILTVSTAGTVELWNERGEAMTRIAWADQPNGASGHPSATLVIAGGTGYAIIHANQLLVIDLRTGEERARHVLSTMSVRELMVTTDGRLMAAGYLPSWRLGVHVIDSVSGQLQHIEGMSNFMRARPNHWVTGDSAPFQLHRPGRDPAVVNLPRSCMPLDERYCSWRDIPGRTLHILDTETLAWRDIDLGGMVDGYEIIEPVRAGNTWALIRCGRVDYQQGETRACTATNLANGRVFHSFRGRYPKFRGTARSDGTPELRIQINGFSGVSRSYAVSFGGDVTDLGPANLVNLGAPRGGTITSTGNSATSIWRDADGRPLAILPFIGTTCGNGWPSWMDACAVSADGRVWLRAAAINTASDRASGREEINETRLILYDVPAPLAPE